MKRFWMAFILLAVLFASGCTFGSLEALQRIKAPENRIIPIEGKWRIDEVLGDESISGKGEQSKLRGNTVQFSKMSVVIDGYAWKEPVYRVKTVDLQEYMLSKFKKTLENLGVENADATVITVTSKDKYLCEVVRNGENEAVAEIQNTLVKLKKVSDKTDIISFGRFPDAKDDMHSYENDGVICQTGLLLGLKSVDGKVGNSRSYRYRTLWIGVVDKELHPVLETQGIFFPRRSGFWRIDVKRVNEAGRVEDIVRAYDAFGGTSADVVNTGLNDWTGRLERNILYLCNDYISIETSGSGRGSDGTGEWQKNRLHVQPIDSLPNMKGIGFADLTGDIGSTVMMNARQAVYKAMGLSEADIIDNDIDDENYGLFRRTGHWFFRGRMGYIKDNSVSYKDYNINIIPPSKLVFFDDLYIPWTEIKDKVPEAVDAYTSPNRDIAVILTRTKLCVYGITQGRLNDLPLRKIMLKEGETPVMAEWATGKYTDNWEKSFQKNKVDVVK